MRFVSNLGILSSVIESDGRVVSVIDNGSNKESIMSLKLIGANVCPFVHRVRLVLAEKALEHEYVAIDLRHKPDWYHDVLPNGRVPLLEHDGARIWESAIVCEYLEEAFPKPPLMPISPAQRAEMRLLVEWSSSKFIPTFYKLLSAQEADVQEEQKVRLKAVLKDLEQKLAVYPGPFLLSDVSLADLELYPWFERWCVLEHYRGLPLPVDNPNVNGWLAALQARGSLVALREKDEFFIEQYRDYAVGDRVPT
jgi:glutathione S-transferase